MKKRAMKAMAVLIGLMSTGPLLAGDELESRVDALVEARLFADATALLESIGTKSDDYGVAQRLLGDAYMRGVGVEKDEAKAIAHYRNASKAGDPKARYQMGLAYEFGLSVPQSAEAAFSQYESAAESSPEAAARYAEIVLANQGRSGIEAKYDPIERLRFAAEHDVVRAKYWLGRMTIEGALSEISPEQAESYLRSATEEVGEANTILGLRAHRAKDYEEAKSLFEAGLSLGDTAAAAYLAHYAEHGIGEPINRSKARDLYEKAGEIEWALEGHRRLEAHFSSITIFGHRIYGMTRSEIRERFAEMDIAQVGTAPYFDAYDPGERLGGRNAVVTVAFAPGAPEYVAEVNYKFETEDRRGMRDLYKEILLTLTMRYGPSDHDKRAGGVSRIAWMKGDTSIQLIHDRKETFLHVTYHMRPYATALAEFVRGQDKQGSLSDAL